MSLRNRHEWQPVRAVDSEPGVILRLAIRATTLNCVACREEVNHWWIAKGHSADISQRLPCRALSPAGHLADVSRTTSSLFVDSALMREAGGPFACALIFDTIAEVAPKVKASAPD